MVECYACGFEMESWDIEYECPYCGKDDCGRGYIICEGCGTFITPSGDEWVCLYCSNEGVENPLPDYDICPVCGGIIEDDGYCSDCGENEDVNQGWLGENYG
jgi:hypothetical protein